MPFRANFFTSTGGRSKIICPPGKSARTLGDQAQGLLGLQVHQQPFGGHENPIGGVHRVHPAEVQCRLRPGDDAVGMGQQQLAQCDDRREIDCQPTEPGVESAALSRQKLSLQSFGQCRDGGRRMFGEYSRAALSKASERRAISWPLRRPNLSKSNSIASASWIASGSSMMASGWLRLVGPAAQRHAVRSPKLQSRLRAVEFCRCLGESTMATLPGLPGAIRPEPAVTDIRTAMRPSLPASVEGVPESHGSATRSPIANRYPQWSVPTMAANHGMLACGTDLESGTRRGVGKIDARPTEIAPMMTKP